MHTTVSPYTARSVLTSLGYSDPWQVASQQARMVLLGRLARYQARIKQLEARWNCTLGELRVRYETQGAEDFAAEDDYLQWQWYADAIETINAQLLALRDA